jgi:hypothetical protein
MEAWALGIVAALVVANLGVTIRNSFLLGKLSEGYRLYENQWREIREQIYAPSGAKRRER